MKYLPLLLFTGLAGLAAGSPVGFQDVYFGACIRVPTCSPPLGTDSVRFTVLTSDLPAVSVCTSSPCMVPVPLGLGPYFYYKEYLGDAGQVLAADPILMPLNLMNPNYTAGLTAPEPSAWLLIGLGLAAIVVKRLLI